MIRRPLTDWDAMVLRLQRNRDTPPRVLSYDRVSGAVQVKGRGLGRQKDMAEAWCKARKFKLDTTLQLVDPGRSASKGHHLAEEAALGRLLRMVELGQIEPGTILLVEAIDRLSRLDVMTTLKRVIFALIEGGVRIVTLEDECEYSLESIDNDWTKVLLLVVRIQAAHEYTKRLAHRVADSWVNTRRRLERGELVRPHLYKPAWCDLVDGKLVLNEKAEVVRRVFRMLRDQGAYSVAKALNEEGVPTLTGKTWTPGNVISLARKNDCVYGVLTANADRRGPKFCRARDERGLSETRYEGLLPVCVPKEEVMTVRALMSSRTRNRDYSGPSSKMRWIGQGITFCSCGSRMTAKTTVKPSGKVYEHLRCTASINKQGCSAGSYPLRPLMAHVLTRLQPEQVRLILGDSSKDRGVRAEAAAKLAEAQEALLVAKQRASNSQTALEKAIVEGWELGDFQRVLKASRDWVSQCEEQVEAARLCVDAHSKACELGELDQPVKDLLAAMWSHSETDEQRQALNRVMRRLRLTITLAANGASVALGIDGSEPVSAPFDPELSLRLLEHSLLGVRYQEQDALVLADAAAS